ncbi:MULTISPECIES: hypothetical protein [unclassified Streptomyces]|uniref:hypothetical protein n=1 Tax=unclassified Streptomyces TaxID=2593676 RepID=UPI00342433AB
MSLGEHPTVLSLLGALRDGNCVCLVLFDDLTLLGRPSPQLDHGSTSHLVGTIDLSFEVRKPIHGGNVEHQGNGHVQIPGLIGSQQLD